jgi:hypothetical protein
VCLMSMDNAAFRKMPSAFSKKCHLQNRASHASQDVPAEIVDGQAYPNWSYTFTTLFGDSEQSL